MKVKPPQCCLSLLWGLTQLTSAKTATAEAIDPNAVAVTHTHHGRMRTPSTPNDDRYFDEERVLPTTVVDQVIRHEFQPFAGKLIAKDVIDVLHKQNFVADVMRNFDNTFDINALNELTHISDENFDLLVIWFGIKSPEDQEVALDLLVARLKENPFSRQNLLNFFKAGKAKANDGLSIIAAAVEKKWLMSMSMNEVYDVLGFSYIWDDEEFVRRVGHSIWERFQIIGEQDFTTFMLTKMRERSEDEIMWTRLIYKLENDATVNVPLSGVFDELLQTNRNAAGNCRPSTAVDVLTSPELSEVYDDVAGTSEEVGAAVVIELFKWSKDELMWAKLIYILQNDGSVPTIPSNVFDHLLQPYETILFGEDQCTPSEAVSFLTSPELFQIDDHLFTGIEYDAKLLTELLRMSRDELMWAKLLFLLKTDKSVSTPLSGALMALLNSWTEWQYDAAAIAETTPLSMSKEVLKDPNFIFLYLYAHFSSDNPDVFLLERLQERSTDDIVWAQALNALREDHNVLTPLSGVFDALLHSWIGKSYNAAAPADNQPALISAYKLLLNCAGTTPTFPQEVKTLVKVLLKWSNDASMWAKFLYKLQQDDALAIVASSAFDFLLESNNAAQAERLFSPSSMATYLTSSPFLEYTKGKTIAKVLSHLFATQSPDQGTWAKVLYILQTVANEESKPLYSNWLKTLLIYWTHGATGIAESSNLFIESNSFLESQNFANLVAFARFSSDNPDAFVLEKLRDRLADDFMWARLLNKLRQEHVRLWIKDYQMRKEDDALSGVLSALLHSWVGKPYDAAANERTLIAAYDYLTSQELAKSYNKKLTLGKRNADKKILNRLLAISNDEVMWAKFLSKLKEDSAMGFPLSRVFQTLLQSWKA